MGRNAPQPPPAPRKRGQTIPTTGTPPSHRRLHLPTADHDPRGSPDLGAAPTAWSAQGLMPFLPPDAQDALLDNITVLSAAGSLLATESVPDASRAVPMMADRMRQVTERWRDHGFDVEMTDLWYGGDRNDVVDYLGSHGWNVSAVSVPDLLAAHGLSIQPRNDEEAAMSAGLGYVTATRT